MLIFRSLLLAALCWPLAAFSVTYYVSPNGNDNNNGTSPATAWRTLQRAQQVTQTMQPGDMMLFERGGLYPGKLNLNASGSAAAPIIFGAYGSGPDPIISGGVPVSGWTPYQGNIWRASFSQAPKYVIVNGTPMTLARHPNTGWIKNVQGSNSSLSSPQLAQPNGHWNGATVVARTSNWSYKKMTVTNFSNGTLQFAAIGHNFGNSDWGFFIQNSLKALDQPGEWYYDAATGHLYLHAPGNANPNDLQVLASVHDHGFAPGWQRQYIIVENMVFQGQTAAGVSTETAHNVIVRNCTFRYMYKAISSSGSNNLYTNNTFHDTYASAISIYGEPNTRVENNTFTNIAVVPGGGEDDWGYFGITITGPNTVVRGNVMDNIGYIGIGTTHNGLVERNVVRRATSILNDGAAITLDDCDGVIIRDNIVDEMVCDISSVASDHVAYHKIGFGIYFGNRVIRNSIVERNIVTRCDGAGIHVDHTKLNSGNIVRDNVLFDNKVQLSISDYSNSNTPGGSAPWHVPAFNTVYSGNVMYCVRPEQLCMRQLNVYANTPVDFGTFINNRYFHPYDELSILVQILPASVSDRYTLERWQAERGEDVGSQRSPLRLAPFAITNYTGPDVVVNGTFDQNINGWTVWPPQALLTHQPALLDAGALRVHFTSNAQYDVAFLRANAPQLSVQNGQWYRLQMSLQGLDHGLLRVEVKGQSQHETPYAFFVKELPFSPERRDLDIFIRSDRTESGYMQFINHHTDPMYWIDNVRLEKVEVQPLDPLERHKLLMNQTNTPQSFTLSGCWYDTDNQPVQWPLTLQPFTGRVVYRVDDGGGCGPQTTTSVGARVMLAGTMQGASGLMRTDLRDQGVLPLTEPYTAMSVEVENSGMQMQPSLLQATGPAAIVDWVVLQLHANDADHTVVARRAALVRADGQVVSLSGEPQVTFQADVVGRRLSVRHRNHLPAMTQAPLSASGLTIDFTQQSTALHGDDPTVNMGGLRALWPGDVNGDGRVRYTGTDNDRDPVLSTVGGQVATDVHVGYHPADVNMDGVVKYTGPGNDRDVILSTIGGSVPTNSVEVAVP